MTRVELTEATAPLADYARKAKRGPVVLTRRGRPVAMLRLLTEEEREDYLVSTHPGSGIPLEEVAREAGTARSRPLTRRGPARRGSR